MTNQTAKEAIENIEKQVVENNAQIGACYEQLDNLKRVRDALQNAKIGIQIGARAQQDIHEAEENARTAEREAAEALATNDGVTLTAKTPKKV